MGILLWPGGLSGLSAPEQGCFPREWEIRCGFKPLLIVAFPLAGELYVCVGCLGVVAPSKPVSCATQFLGSKGVIVSAAFFAAASGLDTPVSASCMDSWMASEIFG